MATQLAIRVTTRTLEGPFGASVVRIPLPQQADGEALVRVILRTVLPLDARTLRGIGPVASKLPVIPGCDALGVIEEPAAGSTSFRKGQRVVGYPLPNTLTDGTYQQYLAVPENRLVAVPETVPDGVAVQFWGNPFTAYALLELLEAPKGEWIVQSAAGSALGRMVISIAKHRGIKTINVVRRSAQRQGLLQLGADEVVATDSEDLKERVSQITGGQGVYGGTDCVGGELTGQLLSTIRPGGTLLVYGTLSGLTATVHIPDLQQWRSIQGFNIGTWQKRAKPEDLRAVAEETMRLLEQKVLQPLVGPTFKLEDFAAAVAASKDVDAGKVMLEG